MGAEAFSRRVPEKQTTATAIPTGIGISTVEIQLDEQDL
jgi:hypothetical protein